MRKILFLLWLLALPAFGQVTDAPALINQRGASLPANCQVGQLFFDTDATAGENVYGCTAANTWTLMSGGSSSICEVVGTLAAGDIFYGTSATDCALLTIGSSGKIVQSDGSVPVWSSVTVPTAAGTGRLAQIVASGTSTFGTSAINSGACATVVTTAATGAATTDVINYAFNADISAKTGYSGVGTLLTIYRYPTANNVNWKVCNWTGSSITPEAVTVNWTVTR